jgi:hypothetical protein
VELDERNRPGILDEFSRRLGSLGYRGYFLFQGELVALERFEPSVHQNPENVGVGGALPGRTYINNFVFLPEPGAAARARAVAARSDLRPD